MNNIRIAVLVEMLKEYQEHLKSHKEEAQEMVSYLIRPYCSFDKKSICLRYRELQKEHKSYKPQKYGCCEPYYCNQAWKTYHNNKKVNIKQYLPEDPAEGFRFLSKTLGCTLPPKYRNVCAVYACGSVEEVTRKYFGTSESDNPVRILRGAVYDAELEIKHIESLIEFINKNHNIKKLTTYKKRGE